MTRDELRAAIQDGCDKVLSLSRLLVSHEQRRVVHATRVYWETAPDAELDRLLSLIPSTPAGVTKPAPEQPLLELEIRLTEITRELQDVIDALPTLSPLLPQRRSP